TGITVPNPAGGNYNRPFANLTGIHEVHMGIEFEGTIKATSYLSFNAMFSIGDWKYKGNAQGNLYDENGTPISLNGKTNVEFALDKVKVSDAAQTTAALGFTLKPVKDLSIFGNWNYYDNYYGIINFSDVYIQPNGNISNNGKKGALEYPSYNLFDAGLSYGINLNNGHKIVLTGNVYNLLDTTYISDGKTSNHIKDVSDFKTATNTDAQAQALYNTYINNPLNFYKGLDTSNNVYFGFGRTWAASISYKF
ncbi:MAG: TonB-dependent receptor, partial [Chryseobacterium sp.]|nr:TonB-dependent receptor [Chryseobacterium sp.]